MNSGLTCFFFFLPLSDATTFKDGKDLLKGKKLLDQLNFSSFCIIDTKNVLKFTSSYCKNTYNYKVSKTHSGNLKYATSTNLPPEIFNS